MYAWTNFALEHDEWGRPSKTVKPGDVVTQEILKVSEESWNQLIQTGQVREQPYPKLPTGSSPVEYFKHLQAKAAQGKLTGDEVVELQQRIFSLPASDPTPTINPDSSQAKEIKLALGN